MSPWNSRGLRHWDQVLCPECQNDIDIQEDDASEGEIVACANCGSGFEVMTNPFELRRIKEFIPTPRIHRPAA